MKRYAQLTGATHKELPAWLKKAKIQEAVIHIDDRGRVIWKDGIWKDGTWKGHMWQGGVWEKGTWEKGTWINGFWETGTWQSGTWTDGVWLSGVWTGGIFKGGIWCSGTWADGIWKNGKWCGGEWHKGEWCGGKELGERVVLKSELPDDDVSFEVDDDDGHWDLIGDEGRAAEKPKEAKPGLSEICKRFFKEGADIEHALKAMIPSKVKKLGDALRLPPPKRLKLSINDYRGAIYEEMKLLSEDARPKSEPDWKGILSKGKLPIHAIIDAEGKATATVEKMKKIVADAETESKEEVERTKREKKRKYDEKKARKAKEKELAKPKQFDSPDDLAKHLFGG